MSESWSLAEVEATVEDYFTMLTQELRGEPFNKAEHNRHLQLLLRNRPRGAIERKHQNISAILIEAGYPYIDGYKPLGNYQQLLRSVVHERLSIAEDLGQVVEKTVLAHFASLPLITNILSIQVPPPKRGPGETRLYEVATTSTPALQRNYLEIEARNRSLGRAGEEMIVRFERERLRRAGREELAERIEHVSDSRGDHLGYDIQSFEADGRNRLIEVKTTQFGAMTPFFASRNEVNVSEANEPHYHVYRLFSFREQPKLFVLGGAIRKTCEIEAVSFSALPR